MCFGGDSPSNPNINPAPYSTGNAYKAVTETAKPVGPANPALSAQAAAADELDQPTAKPTGYSVTTPGVATSGIATM